MNAITARFQPLAVCEIAAMNWVALSPDERVDVAWTTYFFSVQCRESLNAALQVHPDHEGLKHYAQAVCQTTNLSPWTGVASPGEAMHHDEFLRRVLTREPVCQERRARLQRLGAAYLVTTRGLNAPVKAMGVLSYLTGGLDAVYRTIQSTAQGEGELMRGFRYFLTEHVRLVHASQAELPSASSAGSNDGDSAGLMWTAFRDLLLQTVPSLSPQSR